ncbi:ABC transporter substrate-binding protein [soil metagenome]
MSLRRSLSLLLVLGLLATACGGADEAGDIATTDPGGDASETADSDTAEASCAVGDLPLVAEGTLTVATGEPVFEPWMVDDDPTNGEGFESAVVYALAEQMGFATEDVEWVRTGFDEAIGPGEKDYDFNIQQYSITDERDQVVDFSQPYYVSEQAIIAAEGSDIAGATSVGELTTYRLGAAIGTTSLNYIEDVIQPDAPAQVYNDNAAAKAAFDAGQVDGILFDLPTAFFITAVEITDATIVGVLPRTEGEADELGMLFAEGSELVPCVDEALAALEADGALDELETRWLQFEGEIPTLDG